jgi:hypothetical protein
MVDSPLDVREFVWKSDSLSKVVEDLLFSTSREEFDRKINKLKGKAQFKNTGKQLPSGNYIECYVTGSKNSGRIVIDKDTLDIYPTRDHYKTMTHAGRALPDVDI